MLRVPIWFGRVKWRNKIHTAVPFEKSAAITWVPRRFFAPRDVALHGAAHELACVGLIIRIYGLHRSHFRNSYTMYEVYIHEEYKIKIPVHFNITSLLIFLTSII
jgi:hypothetical protein